MGAKGLGQFMPKTWRDMEVKLWGGEYKDVFNPIYNIQGYSLLQQMVNESVAYRREQNPRGAMVTYTSFL